jgi:predicted nucleic acid-binding protein
MGTLIDTGLFIGSERGRFDWIGFQRQLGTERTYIAAITFAEMVHGAEYADTPQRIEKRLQTLRDIEANFSILEFGRADASIYGRLLAFLERKGELIGLHDLMIAATALRHGLRVATLNSAHFRRIPDLEVLDAEEFRRERRR